MATARARAGARPLLRDHPEWWVYGAAVGAWVALFATASGAHGGHATAPSWGAAFGSWTLMVVAMMAPFAAARARAAAGGGLWRLRGRSPLLYVAGFVLPWIAFAAGAAALQVLHTRYLGPAAAGALAAGVATAWQATRLRGRALGGCGRTAAIPARGLAWAGGTLRAGGLHGLRCVATCWAAMLIMVPLHHPVAMLCLFGVQLHERRDGPNPFAERRSRPAALVYGAIALASLAAA